ncbi:hypothetical protein LEP1GSC172_1380 [Leptospira noguchii]|uniref:Uncharacterized protein n=2 Tax=Leptospira noguchii TaxID=28182 RepID=T0F9Q2_9LEPT|nr:hypothetical protein LEP1GSC172_1380 [Leptospira noguchii]EQA69938.1 hypothetical protein LEP1GSC059_2266 [Leptospira noguchii serovar Panama str. CZ214]
MFDNSILFLSKSNLEIIIKLKYNIFFIKQIFIKFTIIFNAKGI